MKNNRETLLPKEENETCLHPHSYQEEQKSKVRRQVEEPVGSGFADTKGKAIYLFNCDNLCNLSEVESLLKAVENRIPFKISEIVKHPFRGGQITDEVEKTIPSLKDVDYAVFVVHAHESSLSFNEDSGYGKIYRALKKQTSSGKLATSDYIIRNVVLFLGTLFKESFLLDLRSNFPLYHPTGM